MTEVPDTFPRNYCIKIDSPDHKGWISSGFGPGDQLYFRSPQNANVPTLYFERDGDVSGSPDYTPLVGTTGYAASTDQAYEGWSYGFLAVPYNDDPGSNPDPASILFSSPENVDAFSRIYNQILCRVAGEAPGSAFTCRVQFENGLFPDYYQFLLAPPSNDRKKRRRRDQKDEKRQFEDPNASQVMQLGYDLDYTYSLYIDYDPNCGTYPEEAS